MTVQMTEPAPKRVIDRRSLHEQLVNHLRTMILEGELAQGSRIAEKELCALFGISRTPLREALKVLARDGFVVLNPGKGAAVASLSPEELEEAFPVMGALEALAGELACLNASDAEIEAIRELNRRMAEHHRRGELDDYFRLNEKIHLSIAAAARNATLSQMQRSLDRRVRRGRYQANVVQERWDQAMTEHNRIVDALVARDSTRIGRLLKDHLANKLASLRRNLPEDAQPKP